MSSGFTVSFFTSSDGAGGGLTSSVEKLATAVGAFLHATIDTAKTTTKTNKMLKYFLIVLFLLLQ